MVAQTNLQLYNQLRGQGLAIDDQVLVRRAYELSTSLYSGYFQGDGKPFASHSVGVASVLAEIGQPAEVIVFGLLHNVYGNGNFGDDRGPGPTPERCQLVRDAVGDRVDLLLGRFGDSAITEHNIDDVLANVRELDETERILILVNLADRVDKYVDLGVLYFGDGEWIYGETDRIGARLIELADALGEPRLARMLSEGFERVSAEAGNVPKELRPSDGRARSTLVVPRSCRRRFQPRLAMRRVRGRLRLRTRLRGLRAPGARQPVDLP